MNLTLEDKLHLTGCLALYFHRRDEALGITWRSRQVNGLLWYYRKLQEQAGERLTGAALLTSTIAALASQINDLVAQAENAEDKQAIARQVMTLKTKLDDANHQFEVLTNGQ